MVMQLPTIINREKALAQISLIRDDWSRECIELLIADIQRFFDLLPSLLMSPFDLVFLVEVLKERVSLLGSALDGSQEKAGWFEDYEFPLGETVPDPSSDRNPRGVRRRQAWNYEATKNERRLRVALSTLIAGAESKQRVGSKRLQHGEWIPVESSHPDEPFDCLFMAMAVDYALRPGGGARTRLESGPGGPESPQWGRIAEK